MWLFGKGKKNPYVKWDGKAAEAFSGGSGTKADPYIVKTPAELLRVAELVHSKVASRGFFKLGADIYYNDVRHAHRWNHKRAPEHIWTPIAHKVNFGGMIDGDGHTIYGLYVNLPEKENVGFIAKSLYGTVANLTIDKSYFRGKRAVGGFIGLANTATDLINCKNWAHVEAVEGRVGGIVGSTVDEDREGASVYFHDCENYGCVTAKGEGDVYVGGILGYCHTGTIRNEILNCKNLGSVSAAGNAVGGIIGGTEHLGFGASCLVSCENTGYVNGGDCIGGIAGRGYSSEILTCYNFGEVTGEHLVGGIVGIAVGREGSVLTPIGRCADQGYVSGDKNVGRIAGSVTRIDMRDCLYEEGRGLAVGEASESTVENCTFSENIPEYAFPKFNYDELWRIDDKPEEIETVGEVITVNQFAPRDGKLRFYTNKILFQDITVSKNDGFLFEYEGTLIVIDGGYKNHEMLNTLLEIREKYMRAGGLTEEDIASPNYKLEIVQTLSHYHNDHYTAMLFYISKSPYIKLTEAYYPVVNAGYTEGENVVRRMKENQPDMKITYIDYAKPRTFTFADGNIVVSLLPSPLDWQKYTDNATYWANCNSVWAHVACNGRKFLFTGDTYDRLIETELPYPTALDAMVGIYSNYEGKNYLDVDFVKPAHHARRTTSTVVFEAAHAEYMLLSVRAYHDRGVSTTSGIKYGDAYFMGDSRYVFEVSKDGSVEILEGRARNFANPDGSLITDPNYYYELLL